VQGRLRTAQAAVRAGGATIEASAVAGEVRTKSSSIDLVTDADIQSGVSTVKAILADEPDARFVIEEEDVFDLAPAVRGSVADEEVWLVDPLDGTTSFVHGYPCYSVTVSLLRQGRPVVGATYNVPSRELFSAAEGLGAFAGEEPLCAHGADALSSALLITGFPYDRGALLDRQLEILKRFLKTPVHGIRRDGSAAVDCCHVAAGRADGFWEFGLKPWDMAAGVVILRETGAKVTGIEGEAWTPASTGILAASPALHAQMLDVIVSTTV
jgi:myo-inositol-1(or 4)-monophosphatase